MTPKSPTSIWESTITIVRDFWRCFQNNGSLEYETMSYVDIFYQIPPPKYVKQSDVAFCSLRWTTVPGRGTYSKTQGKTQGNRCIHGQLTAFVFELNFTLSLQQPTLKPLLNVCEGRTGKRYLGETNEVLLVVKLNRASPLNKFNLFIGGRSLQRLSVSYMDATSGYIDSPYYGFGFLPKGVTSSVAVSVPEGHDVMVSFESVHMMVENKLVVKVSLNRPWFAGQPEHLTSKPKVLPSRRKGGRLEVSLFDKKFDSMAQSATGFRLRFSFHPHSALPSQTSTAQVWNCSVPHWPQFQLHLACNLWVQCRSGQDEDDCGYTRCAPSGFLLDNSCYILGRVVASEVWNDRVNCHSHGARLASFNTAEEMERVIEFLWTKKVASFYVGLRSDIPGLPLMYRDTMIWSDKTVAYSAKVKQNILRPCLRQCCAITAPWEKTNKDVLRAPTDTLVVANCQYQRSWASLHRFLCEKETIESMLWLKRNSIPLQPLSAEDNSYAAPMTMITCPDGHTTHCFLARDNKADCWGQNVIRNQHPRNRRGCLHMLSSWSREFSCPSSLQSLPYTLVCDHRRDCRDNSDEHFCLFPTCSGDTPLRCRNSQQCYPESEQCNGPRWCVDGSDENDCTQTPILYSYPNVIFPPPALVFLNGEGSFRMEALKTGRNSSSVEDETRPMPCPDTHFQCPDDGYCLPVYVRCNGVFDCPGKEDEVGCEDVECPGYYRCRASAVCLHPDHVCDGRVQCSQHDDELFCDIDCPQHCFCLGWEFSCNDTSGLSRFAERLRALDVSGSNTLPYHLADLVMLVFLDLSDCKLTEVGNMSFPNLQTLDLGMNLIKTIQVFDIMYLPSLRELILSQNPIMSLFSEDRKELDNFPNLVEIVLSGVPIPQLDVGLFSVFSSIQQLNLSNSRVQRLVSYDQKSLHSLQVIDLRGCALTDFPYDFFRTRDNLRQIFADNYKLCCSQVLPPGFNLNDCHAPRNDVSTCNNLIGSNFYRIVMAVFATLAVMGNLVSLFFRICSPKSAKGSGYSVFVTHLCVSDGLMGVYLVIVGVADRLYDNTYLWQENQWRTSIMCQIAGMTGLVSNEMSAFMITLITLDRFLVIRFPFSQVRFHPRSAQLACGAHWLLALVLVSVPLLPAHDHWRFYSQTGICVPLPISSNTTVGHRYAFAVLIILNMALFLAIAAGQSAIYMAVKKTSMKLTDSNRKQQDINIARRLITIAVTDFLCWFPIGLLAVLSTAAGTEFPGEVNVAMATIVMPLNAAVNPFLYTVNVVLERRRQRREEAALKFLTDTLQEGNDRQK